MQSLLRDLIQIQKTVDLMPELWQAKVTLLLRTGGGMRIGDVELRPLNDTELLEIQRARMPW